MESSIKIDAFEGIDGSYELIDSGNHLKLEKVGNYLIVRSEPRAWWKQRLSEAEWSKADAIFDKEDKKEWFFKSDIKKTFPIQFGDIKIKIKFQKKSKQIGFFPEQAGQWGWMANSIKNAGKEINVLNLFGFTGISTLVAAKAGANVTHLDGSKSAISWAKENQELSGLSEKPIRWILDDALSFVKKEIKRGVKYDTLIIDPPTFGRGPKAEVWKIEEDLPKLLDLAKQVLSNDPLFIILNLYSTELSAISLGNMLREITSGGKIELSELAIKEKNSDRLLPMSISARWNN